MEKIDYNILSLLWASVEDYSLKMEEKEAVKNLYQQISYEDFYYEN